MHILPKRGYASYSIISLLRLVSTSIAALHDAGETHACGLHDAKLFHIGQNEVAHTHFHAYFNLQVTFSLTR